jgi:glycoprotein endo-alpha-1,2-mannosidase
VFSLLSFHLDRQIPGEDKGYSDRLAILLLDVADRYGLKVCFHLEPWAGKTAVDVANDLRFLVDTYGRHPAFYRYKGARSDRALPLVYAYDSYQIPEKQWREVLQPDGRHTVRGTYYDAYVVGLLLNQRDVLTLGRAGFDGCYSYFAATGFTQGSTPRHWVEIQRRAKEQGLFFVPSVGPGYADLRIRPWNRPNQRSREEGAYYDRMWQAALALHPPLVSITSYNEWHEGTQLEAAQPERVSRKSGYRYTDYGSRAPDYYLLRTSQFVEQLVEPKKKK